MNEISINDAVLFGMMRETATNRIIEFLNDPKMDGVRSKIRRGLYGSDPEMGCRIAILEQIGTIGEPGLRLGLLVYSLEILLDLVNWNQVVVGIS
jgi:hypothetical protein